MKDLLSMGPPVYFVVKAGLNYSDTNVQNLICGGQGCNSNSLSTQLFRANLNPERYSSRLITRFKVFTEVKMEVGIL
jgi:Niemann-Pick C1 protein